MEKDNRVAVSDSGIFDDYIRLVDDPRINVWHLSIYVSLCYLSYNSKGSRIITSTRKEIMQLSHVSSFTTYHKCIRQLVAFGYIGYTPSYNYYRKTAFLLHAGSCRTGGAGVNFPTID